MSDGDPSAPKPPSQGTLVGFGVPQVPEEAAPELAGDQPALAAPYSGSVPDPTATPHPHVGASMPQPYTGSAPQQNIGPGGAPQSSGTATPSRSGSGATPYVGSGGAPFHAGPAPHANVGSGGAPQSSVTATPSRSGSGATPYANVGSGGAPFHAGQAPHANVGSGGVPATSASEPGSGTQPHLGAPIPEARIARSDERSWGVSEIIEEVPGSKFVSFLKISAKRAFRLRIEPTEVLPAERAALERASPPIVDPNLQAFLAWRRSVLFLVACALVPLTVIGFLDGLLVGQATPIRVVKLAPVIAEGLFLLICWSQLRRWAYWRKQRRMLMLGWALFLLTPFIVFIYPLRTVFEGQINAEDIKALNLGAITRNLLPFKITMVAMLQLAPKAISLMPGLVRASLVIKLLFPGSPAPGWLIVVAAPIYALLAYVILIVPYQFTGSGWFVGGVLGIIAGQVLLARSGFALAQPLTESEALYKIKQVRKVYLIVMTSSAVLIVIALGSLVAQLNLHPIDVFLSVLKFEANVLILTLIGSDLVITNLDKARTKSLGRDHVEEQAAAKIAAFVSLDAPHVPPPSGPAPTHHP